MSYVNEITRIFQAFLESPTALVYSMFPLPTGNGVSAGAALTSGAGAWGVYADVVPVVAGIATEFWVWAMHYLTIGGGVVQITDILVADATPTVFFYDQIDPTATTTNVTTTNLPFPKRFAAASQIQGKAGGAAARTINVAVMYMTGI